jgi:hypothetical protein
MCARSLNQHRSNIGLQHRLATGRASANALRLIAGASLCRKLRNSRPMESGGNGLVVPTSKSCRWGAVMRAIVAAPCSDRERAKVASRARSRFRAPSARYIPARPDKKPQRAAPHERCTTAQSLQCRQEADRRAATVLSGERFSHDAEGPPGCERRRPCDPQDDPGGGRGARAAWQRRK